MESCSPVQMGSWVQSVRVPFRIIFPRPLSRCSQWRCSGYFDAPPISPFLIRTQALAPQALIRQSWALVADASQPSPSLGIVLEESHLAQRSQPFPGQRTSNDWSRGNSGQFCRAIPAPELPQWGWLILCRDGITAQLLSLPSPA